MQEIEFRGQQINTKKWIYGYLYRNKGLYVICENIRYAEEEPILLDTIGQYTGLKDKNGKKIFEGDIIKCLFYPDYIFEIKFEEFCWYARKITTSEYIELSVISNYCLEVIGNIYDNPELLEE